MARRHTQPPPRTAGYAWGPERVRLGLSLRRLRDLSGVPVPYLSMIESGRAIPTAEEWERVTAALARAKEDHNALP